MAKSVVIQDCVRVASSGVVTRIVLMSDNVLREYPIHGDINDSTDGYWQTSRKNSSQPKLQVMVKGVSTSFDSTGGKLIGVDFSLKGEPLGVSELLFLKSVDPTGWLAGIQGYAVS